MQRQILFIGAVVLALPWLCLGPGAGLARGADHTDRTVACPNGDVALQLLELDDEPLQFQVRFGKRVVIEPSRLSLLVDGIDLGADARVEKVERYELNEQFPTRGVHSTANNHCRGARFHLHQPESGTRYVVEVRAFDDGVAFRHIVPGEGRRTPDAGIEFRIPAGSTVWHHDLRGHYEGIHDAEPIESIDDSRWIAPPMTFMLPGGDYASITEAALANYPGMALQASNDGVVHERLGHLHPAGHPFTLRFGDEEAERLSHAAAIEGEIVTPWRVVIIGKDLNTLVNSDVIESVSPPPDETLFPEGLHTSWIKPGRSVWKFLDGGENSLDEMKNFSRWASELGFEYNLIEGFWQRWSEEELQSLVDYSRQRGVGIWLWKDSRALRTPEARRTFFELCRDAGVAGVKIDFLDHEAKEVVDLYQVLLREAAEHRLMVNFHGSNKPSGEPRTWPNELTREGVKGMESRRTDRAAHDATLPFTRYLAGHGDYTPVVFGQRRADTTAAHQIATAAVFTSPLLVYGGHPQSLLEHPAVEMIKSIPSVWDETIVLPGSEIGQIAALARRHGEQWFLAILAGPAGRELQVSLSFLDSGAYDSMLVSDVADDAAAVTIERQEVTSADSLHVELANGGGFIARFSPREPRLSVIEPPRD